MPCGIASSAPHAPCPWQSATGRSPAKMCLSREPATLFLTADFRSATGAIAELQIHCPDRIFSLLGIACGGGEKLTGLRPSRSPRPCTNRLRTRVWSTATTERLRRSIAARRDFRGHPGHGALSHMLGGFGARRIDPGLKLCVRRKARRPGAVYSRRWRGVGLMSPC